VARVSELAGGELDEIDQPVDVRDARAALVPGRKRLGQYLGAGRRGDPAGRLKRRAAEACTAQQDCGPWSDLA
jgi:hypothetical protein